jgi:gluconokinase
MHSLPYDEADSQSVHPTGVYMESTGQIIIVMGVSGCGKSTIAEHLAAQLHADFLDGDSLHPPANIDKMARGEPLDDQDRAPWLASVRDECARRARQHGINVTACSALKRSYRDILRGSNEIAFVFLEGSRELIARRMHKRTGHFMPLSLLESQINTLEHPGQEADVYTVSIEPGPEQIAKNAAMALIKFLERPKTKPNPS